MYQPDSEYNRGVIGLGEPPVISPGAAISNAVCNALGVRAGAAVDSQTCAGCFERRCGMKSFEYVSPRTESEMVALLNEPKKSCAILAGGTDLVPLMKASLVEADRVVDIRNVETMQGIQEDAEGTWIGALAVLDDVLKHPLLGNYESVRQVADGVHAIQVQSSGTVGGDLCLLPNCWYFRNGYGLLGMKDGESLPATGENRYHAILGNKGPAKFVSASRLAPALIAWGAKVRIVGPTEDKVELLPLEYFFQAPKTNTQGVTVLKRGQLLTHVWLPKWKEGFVSGTYEALQSNGLDWPLAAASSTLEIVGGLVRQARVVLGHVAPTPWLSPEAASTLIGQPVNEATASRAADAAVADATPLSENGYKVQIARAAVKRSLLRSVGQLEGGL
ncbi:MAG: FAD binding domain-containing protein [Planctomycetales bacterium]